MQQQQRPSEALADERLAEIAILLPRHYAHLVLAPPSCGRRRAARVGRGGTPLWGDRGGRESGGEKEREALGHKPKTLGIALAAAQEQQPVRGARVTLLQQLPRGSEPSGRTCSRGVAAAAAASGPGRDTRAGGATERRRRATADCPDRVSGGRTRREQPLTQVEQARAERRAERVHLDHRPKLGEGRRQPRVLACSL